MQQRGVGAACLVQQRQPARSLRRAAGPLSLLAASVACGGDYAFTPLPPLAAAGAIVLSVDAAAPSVFEISGSAISVPWPRGVSSAQVMVYDHGVLSLEQPGDGVEMIASVGRSTSGTVLVGTTRGSLIRRSSTRWISLFSLDSDEAINAVSGLGDGAVFATVAGNVGYYAAALGLCRSNITPLPNRPTSVVTTVTGGWMFVGSRPFGSGPSQAGIIHLLE